MKELIIAVPSRKRSDNIPAMRKLLPSAWIVVDEKERADYADVAGDRLVCHPSLPRLGAIRQWILEHFDEEGVVQIDDDLQYVDCVVGHKKRIIRDPQAILRMIENTFVCSRDLGLPVFTWYRTRNTMHFKGNDPIGFTGPLSSAWGVVGREVNVDSGFTSRNDAEITMRVLQRHRIIYIDQRFYFYVGKIWAGQGGLQGIRTQEIDERERAELKKRWGRYLKIEALPEDTTSFSTGNVRRRQAWATR